MDIILSIDEFAVLEWLYNKTAFDAKADKEFLLSELLNELRIDEFQYDRIKYFLLEYKLISEAVRESTAANSKQVIRITPTGMNVYRHAAKHPGDYIHKPSPKKRRTSK